jgi:hypothetical protein
MELITCNNPQKDSIATFDTLCTTPQIQLMKVLIPFIPRSMQGMMAFYIKYMELNYTMKLLKHCSETIFCPAEKDISHIYDEIEPYLPPKERTKMKSMKEMMDNLNNMREMMDMVNSMKDLFPDGFDMSNMGDMDNIFDMMNQFGGMNGTNTETTMDE